MDCDSQYFAGIATPYFPACAPPPAAFYQLGKARANDLVETLCPDIHVSNESTKLCLTEERDADAQFNGVRASIKGCFDDLAPAADEFTAATTKGLTSGGSSACSVGEPCRDFNAYVDSGDFAALGAVCGLDLSDAWGERYFVASADATLKCQQAAADDDCSFWDKEGCKWSVPISPAALISNTCLVYVVGGVDMVAQMPGCVGPVECQEFTQQE
ncbi:hypothetical protein TeGR_g9781 [Tetraparma gracilis]|uniref:Uncharacterized protein n=1 Tax=Tetraparma gracilis TaxID=2962635 RepID=A0ABQ6N2T3_9STRA|nr:hypothetical protein TeGR_g9781 [Tetraparma gracilis]